MIGRADTLPDPGLLDRLARVFSLADYNTRVVLLGATLLGVACGVIGTFMLLRKRSLMADAVSHATLPGIAVAFLVMTSLGGDGKSLPGLLLGAFVSGTVGMLFVLGVTHGSKLKQDAALGLVLSVFFGLGVALLGIVQSRPQGQAAGLESFVFGKTASMLASDAALVAVAAGAIVLICAVLFKEFSLLCFDLEFSAAQGRPVVAFDLLMMGLVVAVTVIGLQAVGLILIIAMLVIPAAAARFWTDRLPQTVVLAALLGAASGAIGAGTSAVVPDLPAGAIIVLTASAFFAASLFFGSARGIVPRALEHARVERTVARQHVLRAMYEWLETRGEAGPAAADRASLPGIPIEDLAGVRTWSRSQLGRALARAARDRLVAARPGGAWALTREGFAAAKSVVRNHRLWEIYLITHADVAPSHVDRNADRIEHVLGRAMVERLEALLEREHPDLRVPPTPHPLLARGASEERAS